MVVLGSFRLVWEFQSAYCVCSGFSFSIIDIDLLSKFFLAAEEVSNRFPKVNMA